MKRPRGNRKSKVAVNNELAVAIKLMNDGTPLSAIAKELNVSRTTLWRNLSRLTIEMATAPENRAAFSEFKQNLVEAHLLNAQEVHDGVIGSDVSNAITKSLESAAKLTGANAPTTHLTAHVTDESSPKFLMFKKSTTGLSDGQLEVVYKFASGLPRNIEVVRDAEWYPSPKLLNEGE